MAIPELDDLKRALAGRDTQVSLRRHLVKVIDLLEKAITRGDNRLDTLEAAKVIGDRRLDTLEAAKVVGDQRLTTLETSVMAGAGRLDALEAGAATHIVITVVANLGALPASANPRQWYRVQGDPAVYIGNGAGQPLGKLIPA